MLTLLLALVCVLLLASCTLTGKDVELIPLEVLFGNPDKVAPQLSPDGKYLSYVAPHNDVLNIWIRTAGTKDDQPVTFDTGRGIKYYNWAYNGEQVLYVQDQDGDENYRVYSVNVITNEVLPLTPEDPTVEHSVRAMLIAAIPERPDEFLIGMNKRDERVYDVYVLNTRTGEMEMVEESPQAVTRWVVDHSLTIRGYLRINEDGGSSLLLRGGGSGPYQEKINWGSEDLVNSNVLSYAADNNSLYIIDSRNRNTGALLQYNCQTEKSEVIAVDKENKYDVAGITIHPTEHTIQAVQYRRDRIEWEVLDPGVEKDFEIIRSETPGDFYIKDRTLDDSKWLISYHFDDGPVKYYYYDRNTGKLSFMFNHREKLIGRPLVNMKPIEFTSRDGLEIHGYLTLPKNWNGPGPMILNVHGGPWSRDIWLYDPEPQFFANRGYACLQVNFRGSTGYGKDFVNAGDREWGAKMQDDLTDGVQWAIDQGIADPEKVVIFGGSYGGYATLAGITFTPDLYRAAVASVAPANLEKWLGAIPPYWEAFRKVMDVRVGRVPRYESGPKEGQLKPEEEWDETDKKDIEFLRTRSPYFHVDNIRVPLLYAQGANDQRIKIEESDSFVKAMRERDLEVEYVVYENEGHGFARPENRLDFYKRAEKFLSKHLGGRLLQD